MQTAQVLELIQHLREQGLGVVVISHNLENVFSVADRIAVLRLGRLAAHLRPPHDARARTSSRRSPAPQSEHPPHADASLHFGLGTAAGAVATGGGEGAVVAPAREAAAADGVGRRSGMLDP